MLRKSHKSLGKPKGGIPKNHRWIAGHEGMTPPRPTCPKTAAAKGGDLWFSTLGLWSQCGKSRLGNSVFVALFWVHLHPGCHRPHRNYYTFSSESQPKKTFFLWRTGILGPGGGLSPRFIHKKQKSNSWGMMDPCWFISWRMISGRRMFQVVTVVVPWLIVFCHLSIMGCWHPFQMTFSWLSNGCDPNYLLSGMILKASLRWKTLASLLNYELGFAFCWMIFDRIYHGIHHH